MDTENHPEWRWLTLKTGEQVMVDAEDYERLNKRIWMLRKKKSRRRRTSGIKYDME